MFSFMSHPGCMLTLFVVLLSTLGLVVLQPLFGNGTERSSPSLSLSVESESIAAPKVKVLISVEALCIGCKGFMNEQLFPTYQLLGPEVMDLEVVVFGNAEIDKKKKQLDCQHGPAECDANSYEQCAVSIYPHASRYLPFLHCLDNTLEMGYREENFDRSLFAECARESALDFKSIAACHDDPNQAWKLQKAAAKRTPSEHTYVPWVVINGLHSFDEDKDSLLEAVCRAYSASGGTHPACSSMDVKIE